MSAVFYEFVSDEQKGWVAYFVGEEKYQHHDLAREWEIVQRENF